MPKITTDAMDEYNIIKCSSSQCAEDFPKPNQVKAVSVDNGGQPAAKYREEQPITKFILTDFPDEVLCEIFKYLDSGAQCMLMKCCMRFKNLLLDRRFWQKVESDEELPLGMLQDILEGTYDGTSCIKLRGLSRPYTSFEVQYFNRILEETFTLRSKHLSTLELHGVTIDLVISLFPKSLKRLILYECDIKYDRQDIFKAIAILNNLEDLAIEFSRDFQPYYLMDLSEIPNLRWLSLRGCPRLFDLFSDGLRAARYGFKKLECLDLRCAPINDVDLQCFNVLPLKEILLECTVNKRYKEAVKGRHVQTYKKNANANDCKPSTSKASSGGTSAERPMKPSNTRSSCIRTTSPLSSQPSVSSSRPNSVTPSEGNSPQPAGNLPSSSRAMNYNNHRHIREVESPNILVIERPRHPSGSLFNNQLHCGYRFITDNGIRSFCRPRYPFAQYITWNQMEHRPGETSLERLTVRHYESITDISLKHLALCAPQLRFLDVSGTSVTRKGIQGFVIAKPDCKVIADHLEGL